MTPRGSTTPARATSGREYMAARLASEQARRQSQEALHSAVRPLAIDSVQRDWNPSHLLFSAAYLIRRDLVEQFRQRVLEVAATHEDLRVLCTGPWPPYHFVPRIAVTAEAAHVG
jgi:hypothetical protein